MLPHTCRPASTNLRPDHADTDLGYVDVCRIYSCKAHVLLTHYYPETKVSIHAHQKEKKHDPGIFRSRIEQGYSRLQALSDRKTSDLPEMPSSKAERMQAVKAMRAQTVTAASGIILAKSRPSPSNAKSKSVYGVVFERVVGVERVIVGFVLVGHGRDWERVSADRRLLKYSVKGSPTQLSSTQCEASMRWR